MDEDEDFHVVPLVIFPGGIRTVIGEAKVKNDGTVIASIETMLGYELLADTEMSFSLHVTPQGIDEAALIRANKAAFTVEEWWKNNPTPTFNIEKWQKGE